ncbi:hypothetical protein ABH991_005999 [Bradyrhizobium ottawaense]|jgi:hypothetical protein|uniref:Uncharacterized protein n=1 Tax=Bradyrhizobium ottawaense TaxID=931866 RepID=A0ABV4G4H9_9BRAD|nr:hypothetical protein SG09_48360 [Bradyrhizobium ottawaense]BBO13371.1 hypothetical protein TM102_48410 [Bradyrhizobium sp. TM102]GMO16433.1 hypothetical protein BwSH14_06510 [Bradyrhizobium ottawaense]GMO39983.1 hypothetical protein BwSF12_41760 [Bradyrhizobium ottawaense]GMO40759.1 hypothetical protein BwSF21_51830 [Bradyrhizobium ottawaense]
MAWKHCVALLAIVPRRKVVATALVYGLSLSVRFTSATGEEVEIPTLPATSIVTRDGAPVLRDGWPLRASEPITLQLARASRGCQASCERPTILAPDCSAP